MKRFSRVLAALTAAVILVAGCGYKDIWENRTEIRRNGQVRAVYADAFSEDKYDFDFFREEVEESVALYNENADAKNITLKEVTLEEGKVRVVLYYADSTDNAAFNERVFYNGTLSGAAAKGLFDESLYVASADGTEREEAASLAKTQEDLLACVLEENTTLKVPGTVLYVSDNCKILSDGTVKVSAESKKDSLPERAVIVYKA